jgi:hypothetical protein
VNAGREMDALVAEKVMGVMTWGGTMDGRGGGWCRCDVDDSNLDDDLMDLRWCLDCLAYAAPPASTSIEVAWQMVEKLNHDHWLFLVCQPHDGNHAAVSCFQASAAPFGPADIFENIDYFGSERVTTQAETAPLAICLAALKAVGVTVKVAA